MMVSASSASIFSWLPVSDKFFRIRVVLSSWKQEGNKEAPADITTHYEMRYVCSYGANLAIQYTIYQWCFAFVSFIYQ